MSSKTEGWISFCLMLSAAVAAVTLLLFEYYDALWTFAAIWATVFLFHVFTYRKSDTPQRKILILPPPLCYVNAFVDLLELVLPMRCAKVDPDALLAATRKEHRLFALNDERRTRAALDHYARIANSPMTHWIGRMVYLRELKDKIGTQLQLAALKADPEGLGALRSRAAEHLGQPLWIVGMPRSGTTHLFALLALDPPARAPAMWQIYKGPLPLDPASCAQRRRDIKNHLKALFLFPVPHEVGCDLPEEDWLLLQHLWLDLNTMWSECDTQLTQFMLHGATKEELDEISQDFRLLLDACVVANVDQAEKLQERRENALASSVESSEIEDTRKPHWIFKSIAHTIEFSVLSSAVPNARYVVSHRNPASCCASYASLSHQLRTARANWSDVNELGHPTGTPQHPFARGMDQLIAYRRALAPDDERARFLDVRFDDIVKRPLETVKRIYAHFGMEYTPAFEKRMQVYLDEHPRDGHKHHYTAKEFGVLDADVDRDFEQYKQVHAVHLMRDNDITVTTSLPRSKDMSPVVMTEDTSVTCTAVASEDPDLDVVSDAILKKKKRSHRKEKHAKQVGRVRLLQQDAF